jgi:hypothetical protein
MTDLDDFRLDRYPEPTPEERDGFAITDDDLAEWALRKLAAYRSEIPASKLGRRTRSRP